MIDIVYGSYFSFLFIIYQDVYDTIIFKNPKTSNQSYSPYCLQLKFSLFQFHSLVALKIFKSIP